MNIDSTHTDEPRSGRDRRKNGRVALVAVVILAALAAGTFLVMRLSSLPQSDLATVSQLIASNEVTHLDLSGSTLIVTKKGGDQLEITSVTADEFQPLELAAASASVPVTASSAAHTLVADVAFRHALSIPCPCPAGDRPRSCATHQAAAANRVRWLSAPRSARADSVALNFDVLERPLGWIRGRVFTRASRCRFLVTESGRPPRDDPRDARGKSRARQGPSANKEGPGDFVPALSRYLVPQPQQCLSQQQSSQRLARTGILLPHRDQWTW